MLCDIRLILDRYSDQERAAGKSLAQSGDDLDALAVENTQLPAQYQEANARIIAVAQLYRAHA